MKLKEETDDLIVLADNPKEFKRSLLFFGIFTLVIIATITKIGVDYATSFLAFMGISGIVINPCYLYRNESIIINKKDSNIVFNKFHSSQKIPFSNIIKIEKHIHSKKDDSDVWGIFMSIRYTPDVPWWFDRFLYIYYTLDESEAERFAEKISKITNSKITR